MSKCADKTVYYTEREAKNACKKLWRDNFKRMFYYKCDLCKNYHLTKTKPGTWQVNDYLRKTMPKET